MADPNISNHTIEEVRDTINHRLALYRSDDNGTNASASQNAIDEQDKVLASKDLTSSMIGLLVIGGSPASPVGDMNSGSSPDSLACFTHHFPLNHDLLVNACQP